MVNQFWKWANLVSSYPYRVYQKTNAVTGSRSDPISFQSISRIQSIQVNLYSLAKSISKLEKSVTLRLHTCLRYCKYHTINVLILEDDRTNFYFTSYLFLKTFIIFSLSFVSSNGSDSYCIWEESLSKWKMRKNDAEVTLPRKIIKKI